MRHRCRAFGLLALGFGALGFGALGAAAPAPPSAPAPVDASVVVSVEGMRSARGQVLACLTAHPSAFPDCRSDAAARKLVIPAQRAASFDFGTVPPGSYAIALLHDENGNGKADMALMIPREGFGFSRNPAIRFGPPAFTRAAFTVVHAPVRQAIRMRYIL